jgi:hypothetical protein
MLNPAFNEFVINYCAHPQIVTQPDASDNVTSKAVKEMMISDMGNLKVKLSPLLDEDSGCGCNQYRQS